MGNGWKGRIVEGRIDISPVVWKRKLMGCCDIER